MKTCIPTLCACAWLAASPAAADATNTAETVVEQLCRGYEAIDAKLTSAGATVRREKE